MCCALVSECAPSATKVVAPHVSQALYATDSCPQLKNNLVEVGYGVTKLTTAQNKKANNDAAAVAGSLVFWPALFVLEKDAGNTAELVETKGRYEAIEREAKSKGCW